MKTKPRVFNLRGQKVTLTSRDDFSEEFPFLLTEAVKYPDIGDDVAVERIMSFESKPARDASFRKYGYDHARQLIKSTKPFFLGTTKPVEMREPDEEDDDIYCPACGGFGGESYGSDDGECETCGGSGWVDRGIFDEKEDEGDTDDDGICDVCGEDSHTCECTDEELESGRVIW